MSVVTLCTDPPQFYNGVGPTPDDASDAAAVDALRKLSEVGLEGLCGQTHSGSSAVTEAAARLLKTFLFCCQLCLLICTCRVHGSFQPVQALG